MQRFLRRASSALPSCTIRWNSTATRGKDPLVTGKLERVPDNQMINIFTETVRLNKAIVCLLEEKMATEFPHLKEYAETYDRLKSPEKGSVRVMFESEGQIYPGCDIHEDTHTHRRCTATLDLTDIKEKGVADMIKALAHNPALSIDNDDNQLNITVDFDSKSNHLEITSDQFPIYAQNKKWLRETVQRLIDTARAECKNEHLVGELQQVRKQERRGGIVRLTEFPLQWQRPDMAGLRASQ